MKKSRGPGSVPHGILWRVAEVILGKEHAEEVFGDLIQEATRNEEAKVRGASEELPTGRRFGLLSLSFYALRLALAIRARRSLASLWKSRSQLASEPARAFLGLVGWGGVVGQELAQAFRRIRRAPMYTLLAVSSVTVAVAGAIAILTVVHAVLLRPLAYRQPDSLVAVFTSERDGSELRNPTSPADFLDWRAASSDLATLVAATYWDPGLIVPIPVPSPVLGSFAQSSNARIDKIVALKVTPGLLAMLGVKPLLGRVFEPQMGLPFEATQADTADTADTVVISWKTWQNRLGGANDVVGSEIVLEGTSHTVIGVMPQDFSFPPFWATDAELWAPFDLGADSQREARFLRVFARLAPDVSQDVLEQRLRGAHEQLIATYGKSHRGTGVEVEALREPIVSRARPVLLMLAAGAILLLALMATNLAGLLLAKGLERKNMIATQLAIGASRARLVTAFVVESLLLSICGAIAGTVLASMIVQSSRILEADSLSHLGEIGIQPSGWLITLVVTVVLGALIGFVPGLRLVSESRGATSGEERSPRTERSRRTLVIAEIALTTCLLLLAGLVTRSFQRLKAQDLGFGVTQVATLDIDLDQALGDRREASAAVASKIELLVESLSRQPGVAHVGAVNHLPLVGDIWRGKVFAIGRSAPDDDVRAALRVATPGYFDAMKMRLVAGRFLAPQDRSDSQRVVLINRSLARTLWPGGDALGAMIAHNSLDDDAPRSRVVGVVEDLKQSSLEETPPPEIYYPFAQNPFPWSTDVTLAVRGAQGLGFDSGKFVAIVTDTVPGVAVGSPTTLEEIVAKEFGDERARSLVLLLFAAVATLLAATGVFGMMAFSTHQRRHEMGLRMALGSGRFELVWLILQEAVTVAGVGLLVGGLAALAVGSWTKTLLFETSPLDGAVWAAVALVVVALTMAACLVPALRASRIDPASALDRL